MRLGSTKRVRRALAAKLFAAAGALFLVASLAVASLMKPWATLAELALTLDHNFVLVWDRAEHSQATTWMWLHVVMPLMLRPAWLLPTAAGLVCVGAATTFAWGQQARQ